MKRFFAYAVSGILGAAALGVVAATPAQAAPLAAGYVGSGDVKAGVTLAGHKNHRGHYKNHGYNYYGGWRQSGWHQRHYNKHRNYNYGPRYHHRSYGNVRPFRNFVQALRHSGYRNFHRPQFHGHGRNWTPHYFVSAYDGYGRGVNLRVCAYTGNVLGWRYH